MEAEEQAQYLEERAEKLRKLELDKSEKLRKIKLYFQSKIVPGNCDECDKIFRSWKKYIILSLYIKYILEKREKIYMHEL